MSVTAVISNIARGSLHDGRGIRTVVYFKGCGLRCAWCHNPETLSAAPEILHIPAKCIRCGKCTAACPKGCYCIRDTEIAFDREACVRCGRCAEICPTGALTLCGEKKTVDAVFDEVVKDRRYYEESGGGVTLSGGECLLQADFCRALLQRCREEKIHTVVETALFVEREKLEKVLPFTDFVFADLKLADTRKHALYTGRENGRILENLRYVSTSGPETAVRIPVIPSVNDSLEDMDAFGKIICGLGTRITGVELLKYNTLAESKYAFVGRKYRGFATQPQENTEMEKLRMRLQAVVAEKCKVF